MEIIINIKISEFGEFNNKLTDSDYFTKRGKYFGNKSG